MLQDSPTLEQYLSSARELLAATPEIPANEKLVGAPLSTDFEALRWFELPAACLG